jgi:hypothetical protein
VVDVTNGADVEVRLVPLELRLGHDCARSCFVLLVLGSGRNAVHDYSPRTRLMIYSAIDSGTC